MHQILLCIESGAYLDTRHAIQRQKERLINRLDILYVLRNGYHEKRKDKFDEQHRAWNYAVRGKNIDRRDIRVIVSFDSNDMLIITAIELEKRV